MTDKTNFTHIRADGSAHMVDVTDKSITRREATAQAVLLTRPEVVAAISSGTLPKGEAIGTARIAGIMAAKQTAQLIPLCHPLPLTKVAVDIQPNGDHVRIFATAATNGVTGVEMEALTAASVTALTLYDMIKAVDNRATVTDLKVVTKKGGKSGDWSRD